MTLLYGARILLFCQSLIEEFFMSIAHIRTPLFLAWVEIISFCILAIFGDLFALALTGCSTLKILPMLMLSYLINQKQILFCLPFLFFLSIESFLFFQSYLFYYVWIIPLLFITFWATHYTRNKWLLFLGFFLGLIISEISLFIFSTDFYTASPYCTFFSITSNLLIVFISLKYVPIVKRGNRS